MRRIGLAVLTGGFLIGPPPGAHAAPNAVPDAPPNVTPCDAPPDRLHRLICADANLTDLANRIEAGLLQAEHLLSPAGRATMRAGQAGWKRVATLCARDGHSDAEAAECLLDIYDRRARSMEDAVLRLGPFLFERVDHYAVTPGQGAAADHVRHVAYPRIDQPRNAATLAWNRAVEHKIQPPPRCPSGPADTDATYRLLSAFPRLIGLRWNQSVYCAGLRNPPALTAWSYDAQVLTDPPHPLQVADLFQPDAAWEWVLASVSLRQLHGAARRQGGIHIDSKRVDQAVSDINNWMPVDAGLVVTFPAGQVAPARFGTHDVVVPWSRLSTVLSPQAPVLETVAAPPRPKAAP